MNIWLQYSLCILIGYASGCVLTAELIGKARQVSLYEHGSGNPGMTNTAKVLGKKAAAIVLCGDLIKTVLAVVLCLWLFPDLGQSSILYAGLGCTLGHCFPFWHHFQGGKGVAVVAAAFFLYWPLAGTVALLSGLVCVIAKFGLKIAATVIPAVYLIFLLFRFEWITFIPALAMGILMAWLNLRKNRLQVPVETVKAEAQIEKQAVEQLENIPETLHQK